MAATVVASAVALFTKSDSWVKFMLLLENQSESYSGAKTLRVGLSTMQVSTYKRAGLYTRRAADALNILMALIRPARKFEIGGILSGRQRRTYPDTSLRAKV